MYVVALIPLLLFLSDTYGILSRKRTCKNKTYLSELFYFAHLMLTTYVLTGPFILKEYASNMVFIVFMAISWVYEKILTGTVNCYFLDIEDRICENDTFRTGISPVFVLFTAAVFAYDVYMLARR